MQYEALTQRLINQNSKLTVYANAERSADGAHTFVDARYATDVTLSQRAAFDDCHECQELITTHESELRAMS